MKEEAFRARYPNLDPVAFLQAIAREQQASQATGKESKKSSLGTPGQQAESSAEQEGRGDKA
jgi:hypothetical protein